MGSIGSTAAVASCGCEMAIVKCLATTVAYFLPYNLIFSTVYVVSCYEDIAATVLVCSRHI